MHLIQYSTLNTNNALLIYLEPIVNRFAGRRKSVFAEQYDPEEDEEDENNKVIFPKSDEQRQRLCDAVKNILLFRSLDPEQVRNICYANNQIKVSLLTFNLFLSFFLSFILKMNEILDAMFEKRVKPEDLIIKQGDDGDNFYVIEM